MRNSLVCPYCGGIAEIEKKEDKYTVRCLLCEYAVPYVAREEFAVFLWMKQHNRLADYIIDSEV